MLLRGWESMTIATVKALKAEIRAALGRNLTMLAHISIVTAGAQHRVVLTMQEASWGSRKASGAGAKI
jgi:hypothetical protein